MKTLSTFLLLVSLGLLAHGQDRYRVYFTDKGGQSISEEAAQKWLSPRSLARRERQCIALDYSDIPLYRPYRQKIQALGYPVQAASRWFNYVLIEGPLHSPLEGLPFVKRVEPVPPSRMRGAAHGASSTTFDYGLGFNQIDMLRGDMLHKAGHTGKGMSIAVLDAGFEGADTIAVLDSLHGQGRLKGTFNFVEPGQSVYRFGGSHGTAVLSTMAALLPARFVGTAPHADYWLLSTEDVRSETPAEMDNWVMAAEFADSVGVDVINTSLGYSTFDDVNDDYAYADMDGNTTIITKAADKAAAKGILVVASAGNEGGGSWQYITAPADGDSVLTVGAVDFGEQYVSFSSTGPTYDGRVKPDVMALGLSATIASSNGFITGGSGTSFSSPIVAGLAACLWQAFPQDQVMQVVHNIQSGASLYPGNNAQMGYGVADFYNSLRALSEPEYELESLSVEVYPNPAGEHLNLRWPAADGHLPKGQIEIWNLDGQRLWYGEQLPGQVPFPFAAGLYLVKVQLAQGVYTQIIQK